MSEFTEAQKLISEVCDKVKSMLLEKNRKYGNSALEPKRIFSKANTMEQINVRLDDKLSRVANNQIDEDEDVEMDIIGYLILKQVAKLFSFEENQETFSYSLGEFVVSKK